MPSYQLQNGTATVVLDTGQQLPPGWTAFDHFPTAAEMAAHGYVRMVPRTLPAILADVEALTDSALAVLWTALAAASVGVTDPSFLTAYRTARLASLSAADQKSMQQHAVALFILLQPGFATNQGVYVPGTVAG